ncbi:glycosyltransferase [Moheibacter sediminis]|uniref:Glycosyltransferase involved in cell wall bisynthesis n=1 Tax=Moheibacter sediminis TaxID=1434700 RepID=A0A1W1Z6Z4_9FLAO|nr:glycosyltransferase [Moheibacter sediminis]SMC44183.1 Glycosyltransferase involved in cell wall bisynthesis [Moheibacter sediminis]
MQKKILIVCFDTPFPTNYGGVYDIAAKFDFYKKNNIKVDLICTCFDEKRLKYFRNFIAKNETVIDSFHVELIKPNILNSFSFLSSIPFSVLVRKINYDKVEFLKSNEYSLVLVEHLKSVNRIEKLKKILKNNPDFYLRVHNDEADYYRNLSSVSRGLKRFFFYSESIKYNKFQKSILSNSLLDGFLFISQTEKDNLNNLIIEEKTNILLPVYAHLKEIESFNSNPKIIDFLYVGNLDLDDNFNALHKINSFLHKNNLNQFKLKIVGKCSDENRKAGIIEIFSAIENVDFQFNVNSEELKLNYKTSKFFLNFSSNPSGVKTKLMEAMNFGIPVISNREGVVGSNFEDVVLSDENIDVNWLKNLLNNDTFRSEYQSSYKISIQEKMNWIEQTYHNFFNSKSH